MTDTTQLDPDNIPRHVAIIMDGNGRWAKMRGSMRVMGHKEGVKSVQEIVRAADDIGIHVLTLYAFSTENWKRPPFEVNTLMNLLQNFLQSELDEMLKNNVRLRCIGEKEKLPSGPRQVLENTIARTAGNTGLILNLALSYGSRNEITRAVFDIAQKCIRGTFTPEDISEETISAYLDTAGLPDPDLIIRTGGESRLSNFLLWQASYAEIYITDTMWPDFKTPQLIQSIADYQRRQRRFGKTGDQVQDQQ